MELARPEDDVWDVPVVVFCVWTVVLVISSLIVLSCLKRETKKFNKRLARSENKPDAVQDIGRLESIISRYVRSKLGQGVLATMANSFEKGQEETTTEELRREAESWFHDRMTELRKRKFSDKMINRVILSAIRSGLTKHPMDIRGSRLSLEAARIFLELEKKKKKQRNPVLFLQSSLSLPRSPEPGASGGENSALCPTVACDWVAATFLRILSVMISHPNTCPLLFAFLSFCVWLYDTLSDMVIIEKFWSFQIPILYPQDDDALQTEITYLSYQTLTIDLYAPLLLLVLVFSIMFTLLSCSCSRLSDRYRTASDYSRPEKELVGHHTQDTTTLLSRYDFNIASAVTAPLPQFALQFSAYIIILYMLETLKGLSVDQATKEQITTKIEEFSFASLWFSGVGSGLSLVVAQYSAIKIQHEHCLTLRQRMVYFLACVFNTVAMMSSCLMLVLLVLLPAATYVGRYHIMIIIILGASMLGVGFLISLALASFGLDPAKIKTDRIVTVFHTETLLTAFIRFSQTGLGQWRTILGATTLIGRIFSLVTVNLFLPPSQLLVHPFLRFYSTSPRSPAMHYAIAKQIVYYNILTILSSIVLCVDIGNYGFNYSLTPETKNLLIYVNVCGVPFVFMAHFLLFKFYSTYDLWTSNGVHLVYYQDANIILNPGESSHDETELDETNCTLLANNHTDTINDEEEGSNITVENVDTYKEDYPEKVANVSEIHSPEAESTLIGKVEDDEDEQNDSAEADRVEIKKKSKTVILKKQKEKLNKRLKKSRNCLLDCIVDVSMVDTRGKWVDVSDLPLEMSLN